MSSIVIINLLVWNSDRKMSLLNWTLRHRGFVHNLLIVIVTVVGGVWNYLSKIRTLTRMSRSFTNERPTALCYRSFLIG